MRLVPNPRGQRLAHEPRLARAGDELERLDRAGLLRCLERRGEDAPRMVRVRVRVRVRDRVRVRVRFRVRVRVRVPVLVGEAWSGDEMYLVRS